ncbi:hypothetical protein pb186bvf_016880 [Paramecium bursaria]
MMNCIEFYLKNQKDGMSKKYFYGQNTLDILNQIKTFVFFNFLNNIKLENEAVDGSCLQILVEKDLIDMGIQSQLQRKKLLQWIQIGFKEYVKYLQTKPVYQDIRMPLEPLDNLKQSDFDEKFTLNVPQQQKFVPSQRPVMNLEQIRQLQPLGQSIPQITEEELARQVQYNRKVIKNHKLQNIFDKLEPKQSLIRSPQKKEIIEQDDYILPQFGTPGFDKQSLPKTNQLTVHKVRDQNGLTNDQPIEIKQNSSIGRGSDCTIQLAHDSVSRCHLWITLKEEQFYIQDRGSLIGTFIFLDTRSIIKQGLTLLMGSVEYSINNLITGQQCKIRLFILLGCSFVLTSQQGSIPVSINFGSEWLFGKNQVNDQLLSNKHAVFYYDEDGLTVEDQNSQQGTWLRMSKSGQQSQLVIISRKRAEQNEQTQEVVQNVGPYPINLFDYSSEHVLKVKVKKITNPPFERTFNIGQGMTINDSHFQDLGSLNVKDINVKFSQTQDPISLIIPQSINEQNKQIFLANIQAKDGIFVQVFSDVIQQGIHYVGMPAGVNLQKVEINGTKVTINDNKTFDLALKNVVFFRGKQPKEDENYYAEIINAQGYTSRYHCYLTLLNKQIKLIDGFAEKKSSYGTWHCISNKQLSQYMLNRKYCYRDFVLNLLIQR